MDEWPEQEPETINGERRSRLRYALKMPLEYRMIDGDTEIMGSGTTRDLSSLGIAFEAAQQLPPASQVELSIEWPAIPGGVVPPRLMARGVITRSDGGVAALRVVRIQFVSTRRMAAGSMPALL